jgi:hypothetical protein
MVNLTDIFLPAVHEKACIVVKTGHTQAQWLLFHLPGNHCIWLNKSTLPGFELESLIFSLKELMR